MREPRRVMLTDSGGYNNSVTRAKLTGDPRVANKYPRSVDLLTTVWVKGFRDDKAGKS